jgi:hypothetical protein
MPFLLSLKVGARLTAPVLMIATLMCRHPAGHLRGQPIQPSEVTAHINVWVCRAPTSDTTNIQADLMPTLHSPPQLHYSEGWGVTPNISVRVLAQPCQSLRFVPESPIRFLELSQDSRSGHLLRMAF